MRFVVALVAVATLGLAACSQAEVDQATTEAGDTMQEAGDAVGEAAHETGEAVEGAVNDAATEVEHATDDNPTTN
ncbi:hypothetical protein U91I_01263 [alpha proteobacterium U9-1i]|nr:hypothetical protein U91I_01263 [alpha proteobacterium U9-1i]